MISSIDKDRDINDIWNGVILTNYTILLNELVFWLLHDRKNSDDKPSYRHSSGDWWPALPTLCCDLWPRPSHIIHHGWPPRGLQVSVGSGGDGSLRIEMVSEEDQGLYTCTAKSALDSVSASASVVVEGTYYSQLTWIFIFWPCFINSCNCLNQSQLCFCMFEIDSCNVCSCFWGLVINMCQWQLYKMGQWLFSLSSNSSAVWLWHYRWRWWLQWRNL